MPLDAAWSAITLTLKLAGLTTLILLVLGTPLAWWLARTRSWWKGPAGALVALPLVLPPSVLGFYLLVAMGPNGPLGQLTQSMGLGVLSFTFTGLVIGSVFYSLPFVVQPLQNAFEAIEYAQAHWLAAGMVVFSFAVLLALYVLNPTGRRK